MTDTPPTDMAKLTDDILDAELIILMFTFDGVDGNRARKALDKIMAALRTASESAGGRARTIELSESERHAVALDARTVEACAKALEDFMPDQRCVVTLRSAAEIVRALSPISADRGK